MCFAVRLEQASAAMAKSLDMQRMQSGLLIDGIDPRMQMVLLNIQSARILSVIVME